MERTWMPTFQMQLLNEIQAGHDGPTIPESKRVYFQQRLRDRFFDFIIGSFIREQASGLTKAKLARRIGKSPEIVNRWLAAPNNLTLDSISDLLLGIAGEELEMSGRSVLHRSPLNYVHLADHPSSRVEAKTSSGSHTFAPYRVPV
jgi:hypothetical protein